MTIDELIELLRTQLPADFRWNLDESGRLRAIDHKTAVYLPASERYHCPVTMAAQIHGLGYYDIDSYENAGRQLGLSEEDCAAVVHASDVIDAGPLRVRMIQAFGLEGR